MDTPLTHTPLLTHKHAVIFGAGGAVGTAVAKEFAAQGATVFLSGRTLNAVEQVAADIHQDGGVAYAAQVPRDAQRAVPLKGSGSRSLIVASTASAWCF